MLLINPETGQVRSVKEVLIQMVKDLEDSSDKYCGYAYVRTMRNILIGNKDACIAPFFQGKQYYNLINSLKLEELEKIMDRIVREGDLNILYGKLYCTHEYYNRMSVLKNHKVKNML